MIIQVFPGLEAFCFSPEEQIGLESSFRLLLDDVNMINGSKESMRQSILDAGVTSGVYFWVMGIRELQYRIYIGKTKSVMRRVADYMKEFQAHSPNDYKIRIFQQTILQCEPSARFSLYFTQSPLSDYTSLENELIRKYDPLLNRRAKVSQAAQDMFRNAFEAFYRAGFETTLGK
jgi:excinuclease UvrABC nuclease subunit